MSRCPAVGQPSVIPVGFDVAAVDEAGMGAAESLSFGAFILAV